MILKKTLRLLQPKQSNPDCPLFVFLPGMDGTGQLLVKQLLDGLGTAFDIRCLSMPPDDLTDWKSLVEQTIALIKIEQSQRRRNHPIYLCGESFGGCLALKLASYAPNLFDRLILVNPASSLGRQPLLAYSSSLIWWLPNSIYRLGTIGLRPFLIVPERVSSVNRRLLVEAMQSVTTESAAWRVSLLSQFKLDQLALDKIKQPVLVIAGGADRILPSTAEAERLVNCLPNAQKVILPESGHACLLEKKVKLEEILRSQRFCSQTLANL